MYCPACYSAKIKCRRCGSTHCQCPWSVCNPTTEKQSQVLSMRADGLTAPQIARALNLSIGAVKGRIQRANRVLKSLA
jgi:DNA-binding NarL/FixJ family response regulator